jgi:oxalate decarboxylase
VPHPFNFSLAANQPDAESESGTARIADSHNFPIASTIASALVDVNPGGMREPHWHPNADEWQYRVKGQAPIHAGDGGYVPRHLPLYREHLAMNRFAISNCPQPA